MGIEIPPKPAVASILGVSLESVGGHGCLGRYQRCHGKSTLACSGEPATFTPWKY